MDVETVSVGKASVSAVGTYHYDSLDRDFLAARVATFRNQVERRLAGALSEDEFKPLRLMNGLYLQLHGYMLRCAVPYGVLSSAQLRCFARIARMYDRGYGHFTTRQNIQYNWIRLSDAPDILAELAALDLHAIQTSGNCIRNITTDQFAGAAADELLDPRIHAEILRQWSTDHPEFTYLPRKFKIALTGSPHDRAAIRFHDIGLLARPDAEGRPCFDVYVGGGMGRTPIIGVRIREALPEADMLAYMEAILRVYNAHGRRDNIYKARIKILVQALGAKAFADAVEAEFAVMPRERFRVAPDLVAAIQARFGAPAFAALPAVSEALETARKADPAFARWVRSNTHPHREPGYICAIISLKPIGGIPGDASADQMDAIADLAERYSFGEIRVAHEQNLVLAHVRQDDLYALWQGVREIGLADANIGLATDIIACPGLDYCDLANARSIPIAQQISERLAGLQDAVGELHINISGCINACGHHHAGHIGILGVDKHGVEAYQITLGGSADENAAIGRLLGPALPESAAVDAIEAIVRTYLALRAPAERFVDTVRRLAWPRSRRAALPVLDRSGQLIADLWVTLADDAPVPASGAVVVSLARLQNDPALGDRTDLGVALPVGTEAAALAPFLGRVALVSLPFPGFRDGRAFTVARTLRERYGYAGDIRATGHVLPDQYMFLVRSGVSTVELPETADVPVWSAARHGQGAPDDEPGTDRALPFLRRTAVPFAAA